MIARQYDNLSRRLEVIGDLPEGWEWAVLVRANGAEDIISLEPMEGGAGITLTRDQVSVAGYYSLQLRGTQGQVVKHTNIVQTVVPESLTGSGQWPCVPSEFLQVERRILELNEHPPVPGESGFWLIWNPATDQYEGSEFPLPDGVSVGTPNAVQYVEQELYEEQQIQARTNINALGKDELPNAVNDALAKAKESGEFNGPSGRDGRDGVDGKDGSDAAVTATNIQSALGYTPADAAAVNQLSEEKVDKPTPVVGTSIGEKCAEFSSLMKDKEKVESFLFFTDPHLLGGGGSFDEDTFREHMNSLRSYYEATPTSFIACGGDWLNSRDSYDQACFKLGYLDGFMRNNFKNYYPVMANHDTNYQGVDETGASGRDETGYGGKGELALSTQRNLLFREYGSAYYSFDGANTKFYVLDTGLDWQANMTDYRWEQLAWLATKLTTDDSEHSAVLLHIVYDGGASSGTVWNTQFTENLTSLLSAYNKKTNVTLNGVSYSFGNCKGCAEFVLGGHTHLDWNSVLNDIPLVATAQLICNNVLTFDLCMIDYDNRILRMVRVGSGENRDISLFLHPYTNLIPSALAFVTDEVYNAVGYKNGVRFDNDPSVNHEGTNATHALTGLMPYDFGDANHGPIYIKGNNFNFRGDCGQCRVALFDHEKNYVMQFNNQGLDHAMFSWTKIEDDYWKLVFKPSNDNPSATMIGDVKGLDKGYFCLSFEIGNTPVTDLTVTINEPIQ